MAHVVDYSGHVLRETVGLSEVPAFADFDDPLAAFVAVRALIERVLDDRATPADIANYLDLAVSFDLPQHGWDLARATGQDATIDPEEVEILWRSLSQAPTVWDWQTRKRVVCRTGLRSRGRTAPRPRARRIGRDPYWTPR